jgi:L,D-transpeptidase ErfK/SrfK
MNAILQFLLVLQITGGEFIHTVETGDSITSISARFGVDVRVLAEANGLKTSERLKPGQALRIDNRHIVPSPDGAGIVINLPQRMLFRFEEDRLSCAYPIAAGKPDWRTPLGEFEIMSKEEDPTWDVPSSIQEEMRRAGKPVLTHVPPSPDNPLGEYWIGLSLPGIGIHGTNAPSSIYRLATHGCIRLHPDDVRDLFPRVDIGTKGRVIYEPVLAARAGDSVYLEVHPDAYKKKPEPLRYVLEMAETAGFLDMVDLTLVKEAIQKRDGIARDVTRR